MSVATAEPITTDQDDLTPAQMAMAVAVAYALAAESNVTAVLEAWLAGRFDRVSACYAGAQKILQAIAKATLAGEHYAEVEWNVRPSPKIISGADHERLTRALDKITRDAQQDRADDLAQALADEERWQNPAEVEPEDDHEPEVIMRATRLASAEVITAGRAAYGEAVAEAVGDDPDYVWTFTTDANPCPKCVVLAAKTFPTFEAAPNAGAHPNCVCVLEISQSREDL